VCTAFLCHPIIVSHHIYTVTQNVFDHDIMAIINYHTAIVGLCKLACRLNVDFPEHILIITVTVYSFA
jgi:hypothetical protein